MNKRIRKMGTFFCAMLIVSFFSIGSVQEISPNTNEISLTTELNESSSLLIVDPPECVCAERKGWLFGMCKGATTRVCEGDTECNETCGTPE